ncbi:MAG TPA: hypothetical protein VI479_16865 [Blastocatellia bacterium]
MTKFRKHITPLLITVIICVTLALGYQQDTIRTPNPSSSARPTEQSAEVKDLYLRISNLESKVTQLEKRIGELQKPRIIPANQK